MNARRLLVVGLVALGIFALLQLLLLQLKLELKKEQPSWIFAPEFREFFERYPVPPDWSGWFSLRRVVLTQLPVSISSSDNMRLEVRAYQDSVAILTHSPGMAAMIAKVGDHVDTIWVRIDEAESKKFGPRH